MQKNYCNFNLSRRASSHVILHLAYLALTSRKKGLNNKKKLFKTFFFALFVFLALPIPLPYQGKFELMRGTYRGRQAAAAAAEKKTWKIKFLFTRFIACCLAK